MNFFEKTIAYLISIPARTKGMKLGKGSFIGPRYDLKPILRGVVLGDKVLVGREAWFDISTYRKGAQIIIGNGTNIGRRAMISAARKIVIGEKCLISHDVSIIDHDHDVFDADVSPMDAGITEPKEIHIDDHCFIGARSFILKGVTLGKHCVVGAGSIVTKSFPAYSVIAGNPAKFIRSLKNTHGE